MITYEEALSVLAQHQQSHVLAFWERLTEAEKASLLAQIEALDFDAIAACRKLLCGVREKASAPAASAAMEPAPVKVLEGAEKAALAAQGEAALKAGQVGAIVVAGGQGSRLGFEGPKGCYPVGPISQKPLFWFHARKLLALEKQWGAPVPFYVMTSCTNDAATRAFFEENDYFGLDRRNVFFFTQGMWPALTAEGRIILDAPGHIFLGPDGHGGMLSALEKSGALADMQRRGLKSIFFFQVDNPMVDVADAAFIGFQQQTGSEIAIKVCAKRDPSEGLGVVVERGGKTEIVEYTEFTDEQKNERLADGELRYKYGSVAIHVFLTDFLVQEARAGLPIHIAHKKVPYVDEAGVPVKPAAPNAYKFEKFIFDSLADAKVCSCLAFDRTEEFSPVKNAEGSDSPATCSADLSRKWAKWLLACGVPVSCDAQGYPAVKIEIDPAFANSASQLKAALAGRTIDPEKEIFLGA